MNVEDVEKEIEKLTVEIQRLGSKQEDGSYKVTFGALFEDEKCANMFEALVGTLLAARRRQLLTFDGENLIYNHRISGLMHTNQNNVEIVLKPPTHPSSST